MLLFQLTDFLHASDDVFPALALAFIGSRAFGSATVPVQALHAAYTGSGRQLDSGGGGGQREGGKVLHPKSDSCSRLRSLLLSGGCYGAATAEGLPTNFIYYTVFRPLAK